MTLSSDSSSVADAFNTHNSISDHSKNRQTLLASYFSLLGVYHPADSTSKDHIPPSTYPLLTVEHEPPMETHEWDGVSDDQPDPDYGPHSPPDAYEVDELSRFGVSYAVIPFDTVNKLEILNLAVPSSFDWKEEYIRTLHQDSGRVSNTSHTPNQREPRTLSQSSETSQRERYHLHPFLSLTPNPSLDSMPTFRPNPFMNTINYRFSTNPISVEDPTHDSLEVISASESHQITSSVPIQTQLAIHYLDELQQNHREQHDHSIYITPLTDSLKKSIYDEIMIRMEDERELNDVAVFTLDSAYNALSKFVQSAQKLMDTQNGQLSTTQLSSLFDHFSPSHYVTIQEVYSIIKQTTVNDIVNERRGKSSWIPKNQIEEEKTQIETQPPPVVLENKETEKPQKIPEKVPEPSNSESDEPDNSSSSEHDANEQSDVDKEEIVGQILPTKREESTKRKTRRKRRRLTKRRRTSGPEKPRVREERPTPSEDRSSRHNHELTSLLSDNLALISENQHNSDRRVTRNTTRLSIVQPGGNQHTLFRGGAPAAYAQRKTFPIFTCLLVNPIHTGQTVMDRISEMLAHLHAERENLEVRYREMSRETFFSWVLESIHEVRRLIEKIDRKSRLRLIENQYLSTVLLPLSYNWLEKEILIRRCLVQEEQKLSSVFFSDFKQSHSLLPLPPTEPNTTHPFTNDPDLIQSPAGFNFLLSNGPFTSRQLPFRIYHAGIPTLHLFLLHSLRLLLITLFETGITSPVLFRFTRLFGIVTQQFLGIDWDSSLGSFPTLRAVLVNGQPQTNHTNTLLTINGSIFAFVHSLLVFTKHLISLCSVLCSQSIPDAEKTTNAASTVRGLSFSHTHQALNETVIGLFDPLPIPVPLHNQRVYSPRLVFTFDLLSSLFSLQTLPTHKTRPSKTREYNFSLTFKALLNTTYLALAAPTHITPSRQPCLPTLNPTISRFEAAFIRQFSPLVLLHVACFETHAEEVIISALSMLEDGRAFLLLQNTRLTIKQSHHQPQPLPQVQPLPPSHHPYPQNSLVQPDIDPSTTPLKSPTFTEKSLRALQLAEMLCPKQSQPSNDQPTFSAFMLLRTLHISTMAQSRKDPQPAKGQADCFYSTSLHRSGILSLSRFDTRSALKVSRLALSFYSSTLLPLATLHSRSVSLSTESTSLPNSDMRPLKPFISLHHFPLLQLSPLLSNTAVSLHRFLSRVVTISGYADPHPTSLYATSFKPPLVLPKVLNSSATFLPAHFVMWVEHSIRMKLASPFASFGTNVPFEKWGQPTLSQSQSLAASSQVILKDDDTESEASPAPSHTAAQKPKAPTRRSLGREQIDDDVHSLEWYDENGFSSLVRQIKLFLPAPTEKGQYQYTWVGDYRMRLPLVIDDSEPIGKVVKELLERNKQNASEGAKRWERKRESMRREETEEEEDKDDEKRQADTSNACELLLSRFYTDPPVSPVPPDPSLLEQTSPFWNLLFDTKFPAGRSPYRSFDNLPVRLQAIRNNQRTLQWVGERGVIWADRVFESIEPFLNNITAQRNRVCAQVLKDKAPLFKETRPNRRSRPVQLNQTITTIPTISSSSQPALSPTPDTQNEENENPLHLNPRLAFELRMLQGNPRKSRRSTSSSKTTTSNSSKTAKNEQNKSPKTTLSYDDPFLEQRGEAQRVSYPERSTLETKQINYNDEHVSDRARAATTLRKHDLVSTIRRMGSAQSDDELVVIKLPQSREANASAKQSAATKKKAKQAELQPISVQNPFSAQLCDIGSGAIRKRKEISRDESDSSYSEGRKSYEINMAGLSSDSSGDESEESAEWDESPMAVVDDKKGRTGNGKKDTKSTERNGKEEHRNGAEKNRKESKESASSRPSRRSSRNPNDDKASPHEPLSTPLTSSLQPKPKRIVSHPVTPPSSPPPFASPIKSTRPRRTIIPRITLSPSLPITRRPRKVSATTKTLHLPNPPVLFHSPGQFLGVSIVTGKGSFVFEYPSSRISTFSIKPNTTSLPSFLHSTLASYSRTFPIASSLTYAVSPTDMFLHFTPHTSEFFGSFEPIDPVVDSTSNRTSLQEL
ncbi:hypothetical protein BLNAU_713 [Blattamonas nauphoetae]|uniref:Uncharacterized protein n=1 Tax=Blattamonas nauphoetae TaxID=2049346 RepID=A0ABQ9YKA9_9EUKA|nr:hypothetical protein BLNAU_713 [Blattamonas nauphoetae]